MMQMLTTATSIIFWILIKNASNQQFHLSHDVTNLKTKTCIQNVYADDNGNTLFELTDDGATCGALDLAVSQNGFTFDVIVPEMTDEKISLELSFPSSSSTVPLIFSKSFRNIIVKSNDVSMAKSPYNIVTFEIKRDGLLSAISRLQDSGTVSTDIMEKAPKFESNLVIVNMAMSWKTSGLGLTIRFPPDVSFLTSVIPVTSTTTSSTTNSFINSTTDLPFASHALESQHDTDAPEKEQHETTETVPKKANIIVAVIIPILAILVIGAMVVIVSVIIWFRIRRKRQASTVPPQTSTSQNVPAPHGPFFEFPKPKNPKAKITDHAINFNEYMAVVPAYPHEVRMFKRANPSDKERMYNTFLLRIHYGEGRDSDERR